MKASKTDRGYSAQNGSSCCEGLKAIPKKLWYILLLALLIRVAAFGIYVFTGGNGVVTDSPSYVNPALEFTRTFGFGNSALRTPGYPLLIAMCLGVFGKHYYFGLVAIQILMNVVAVFYVYRLSLLIAKNKNVGYLAAILVAFNPMNIMYNYLILTDCVSQALLLITVYYFTKYICSLQKKEPAGKNVLIAGVLLAINVLIRPSLMYLPMALTFGAVVVAIIFRCYKQILISILCVFVLTQSPVAAWTYRNRAVADYNGYTTVSDINLYYYNSVVIYAKQNGLSYYQAREQMLNHQDKGLLPYLQTMTEYDAIRKRGTELLSSDLPYYIGCCLKNCGWIACYPGAMTFKSVSGGISDAIAMVKSGGSIAQVLINTMKPEMFWPIIILGIDVLLLILLTILSWIGIVKNYKNNWILATLILGVVAYIYVVSCQPVGIGSYSRFRLACSMLTAVLSAQGLDAVIAFFRGKKLIRRKKQNEGII